MLWKFSQKNKVFRILRFSGFSIKRHGVFHLINFYREKEMMFSVVILTEITGMNLFHGHSTDLNNNKLVV